MDLQVWALVGIVRIEAKDTGADGRRATPGECLHNELIPRPRDALVYNSTFLVDVRRWKHGSVSTDDADESDRRPLRGQLLQNSDRVRRANPTITVHVARPATLARRCRITEDVVENRCRVVNRNGFVAIYVAD